MLIATYDPTGKAGDAFDFRNFAIPGETRGDLLIKGSGADWERLAISPTVGFVLTSNGTGSDPSWQAPAGDMLKATFDPGSVSSSAFNFANMSIAGQTAGDMLGFDGTWKRIIPDPLPGRVLVTQGAGNNPAWQTAPFARNGIDGLTLSRTSASQITIAGGGARDDTNGFDTILAAPVVVDFANPNGANGLDTGAEAADTWYDIYLIDGDVPVVAGLYVVQGDAPVLPATYTRKRLIGTRRNDSGSDLIDFLTQGEGRERTVIYLSAGAGRVVLSGGAATVPTFVDCSALVPPTTQAALLILDNQSGTRIMTAYQDTAGAALEILQSDDSRSPLFPLDSSQRMAYDVDVAAGADANVSVRGFVESI